MYKGGFRNEIQSNKKTSRNFSGIINDDTIALVKNEIQKEIDAEYVDKDVLSYIDMGID